MMRWILAAVSVAVVIVGVTLVAGRDEGDGKLRPPITVDPSELVPATDASLAAVALENVDEEPSGFELLYRSDGRYPKGTVGADIRFGAGPGEDGALLRMTASPGHDRPACDLGQCAEVQTASGMATVYWSEEVPDQDPGVVTASMMRDGAFVMVYSLGPSVTGDPRELDLSISVDEMVAIVADPRFGLRTTPEMIGAGETLDGFPVEGEGGQLRPRDR